MWRGGWHAQHLRAVPLASVPAASDGDGDTGDGYEVEQDRRSGEEDEG